MRWGLTADELEKLNKVLAEQRKTNADLYEHLRNKEQAERQYGSENDDE